MKKRWALLLVCSMMLTLVACDFGGDKISSSKAYDLLDDGEYDKAIDMFEDLLDEDDEDMDALLGLVEANIEDEEFKDADRALEDLKDVILDAFDEDEPDDFKKEIKAFLKFAEDLEEEEELGNWISELADSDIPLEDYNFSIAALSVSDSVVDNDNGTNDSKEDNESGGSTDVTEDVELNSTDFQGYWVYCGSYDTFEDKPTFESNLTGYPFIEILDNTITISLSEMGDDFEYSWVEYSGVFEVQEAAGAGIVGFGSIEDVPSVAEGLTTPVWVSTYEYDGQMYLMDQTSGDLYTMGSPSDYENDNTVNNGDSDNNEPDYNFPNGDLSLANMIGISYEDAEEIFGDLSDGFESSSLYLAEIYDSNDDLLYGLGFNILPNGSYGKLVLVGGSQYIDDEIHLGQVTLDELRDMAINSYDNYAYSTYNEVFTFTKNNLYYYVDYYDGEVDMMLVVDEDILPSLPIMVSYLLGKEEEAIISELGDIYDRYEYDDGSYEFTYLLLPIVIDFEDIYGDGTYVAVGIEYYPNHLLQLVEHTQIEGSLASDFEKDYGVLYTVDYIDEDLLEFSDSDMYAVSYLYDGVIEELELYLMYYYE